MASVLAGRSVLVVGLSVRWLAQAVRASGGVVLACDVFGDADTRAAARAWAPAGTVDGEFDGVDAAGPSLDPGTVRRSAALLCRPGGKGVDPAPLGWIAGPGCEPHLAQLAPALAALGLPLLGNPPVIVDAVRDPGRFFAALDALGLPHPAVAAQAPVGAGWLRKAAWGSGGTHIRWSTAAAAMAGRSARDTARGRVYWQRWQAGQPVSLLFLADGAQAVALAWQAQDVVAEGDRPCLWQGLSGPLALPPPVQAAGRHAAEALTRHFGLRGLHSLDGLLDSRPDPTSPGLSWLELNPRCSASMALYPEWPLPDWQVRSSSTAPGAVLEEARQTVARPLAGLRGLRIVRAGPAEGLSATAVRRLAALAGVHDVPAAPQPVTAGAPLVSVSATGASAAELQERLARQVARVRACLDPATAGRAHHHPDNDPVLEHPA